MSELTANTGSASGQAQLRSVRWFAFGLMFGLLAEQTVLFAVPLLIYQDTKSVAYSGSAFALEWIPALVAYPFAGLLADRLGGRWLYLRANFARACCLLLTLASCWMAPSYSVIALMINGFLLSALMAPIRMAVEKTVPRVAPPDRLAKTQALVQNIELLAMAVGPGVGAAIAHFVGKLPLLGLASAAFLAASCCWRVLPIDGLSKVGHRRVGHELRLGWTLLIHNKPVIRLAVINFLINLAFAVALSANAYLITGTFGASDTVFGLLNAAAGMLGLANLFFMPRLLGAWSIYRVGVVGFVVLCIGLFGMGFSPNVWLYVFSFLASMAGATFFNIFNRTQRIKAIAPEHLGKVIGPFYLINCLSYPLGGVISAGFGSALGIQHILLGLAFVLALPGGVLLWVTARYFKAMLEPLPKMNVRGIATEHMSATLDQKPANST